MRKNHTSALINRLHLVWKHAFAGEGNLVNLEDLRSQLVSRLALLLIGVSGLIVWLAMTIKPFPVVPAGFLGLVLGLGVAVGTLSNERPVLARHLSVWGLTIGLLAAMWLFTDPWLPFWGLLLIFVSATLVSGSEIITASLVFALAVWLERSAIRPYPLPHLFVFLMLGLAITWLFVRTLFTALEWMRSMQQRADQLLDEVRIHRGELSRTLKSFEIANSLLRRTERELIGARNQAVQARRLKEQFAANISHELRTPLNLILGFSEMMYLSPEVYGGIEWPLTLRRDVHQIYRSSQHLLAMIDDVLDLSRFEMVGFALNKEPTDIEALLNDTASIATNLFRGLPIQLEVEIASDLPSLEIDRTRIRQVLLNLLNNARRFTSAGTVTLAARQAGNEVILSVSDTGVGISAEKLPHIFDEFYQIDQSLRRSYQGIGLGLAISKRFVEAHGGYIWVENNEGEGATFFFALPIATHVSKLPANKDTIPDPPASAERPFIVVVDPDPAVAAQIDRHFEEYSILQVKEADELDKTVLIHHPRAVVYNSPPDMQQHPNTGITALPVPIIECSLPSRSWMANHLSVEACLTKPITAQQLLQEIERLDTIQNVLIIDDDRGFTQLISRILETSGRGFNLQRAYNGTAGLHSMRKHLPDLVLLDLAMPEIDGFQVLNVMRQDSTLAKVPVILLTATSYIEDALSQYGNQMVIHRSERLNATEVLSCIGAVINVLEPRYDEHSVPNDN